MNRKMIGWTVAAVAAAVAFAVVETILLDTDPPLATSEPGGIVCVPVDETRVVWAGVGEVTNTSDEPVDIFDVVGRNVNNLATSSRTFAQPPGVNRVGTALPVPDEDLAEWGLVEFTGSSYTIEGGETVWIVAELRLAPGVASGEMEGFRLAWSDDGHSERWDGNGPKIVVVEDECPSA